VERRKALLIGAISVILLGGGAVAGVVVSNLTRSGPVSSQVPSEIYPQAGCSPGRTSASCGTTAVLGETYQICAKPRYLTSPWKYHALATGSKSYTVAQYKSLSGYGTTLPPLPGYIAAEDAATEAAIIYAPGSSTNVPAYARPETPVLQFFEGGAYGEISMQSASGDEFIGGTAANFPEPTFDDGGDAGGISGQNDTYNYSGGTATLARAAQSGATAIKTRTAIPGDISYLSFADGTTYPISSSTGTSITLSSGLTRSEAAGAQAWGNDEPPIATVASSAAQGASTNGSPSWSV
jgi:hypothetical protein